MSNSDTPIKENPRLEAYESFLDFVEEILGKEIPLNIRNKNYNLFSMVTDVSSEIELMQQLGKKYQARGTYNGKMIPEALRKREREILEGAQIMLPLLEIRGKSYVAHKLVFVSRKDTFGDFKQKVKDLVFGEGGILDLNNR